MHQGIQGKEVTFKDVLILFLKRFERILAVALAFAVVFAAFGAENTQKLQDDYQLKLDEYNQSTEKLRITIEQQQQRLDSMQQYAKDSIYYNLDAFNEAVSELVFYVDTGYQIIPSQYYQAPNKTGEIVSAYCDAYRSAQLYDGIRDILGDEVEIKYIDELLSVQRAGDIKIKDSVGNVTVRHSDGNQGVVLIRARAQDEQTASAITSFVFQYLRENLSSAIAEHRDFGFHHDYGGRRAGGAQALHRRGDAPAAGVDQDQSGAAGKSGAGDAAAAGCFQDGSL